MTHFVSKSLVFVITFFIGIVGCKSASNSSQLILDEILKDYDYRVRPNSTNAPVVVTVELGVERIGDISESAMEFSATVFVIEKWTDERLQFKDKDPIRLSGDDIYRIWIPDLFFPFEAEAKLHEVTIPNQRVVLYHDGQVKLILRATLKLACPMDLTRIPMDEQSCDITMLSYQYASTDLVLQIAEEDFQLPGEPELSRFRVIGKETKMYDIQYGLEVHSCAKAIINLQRRLETYALTVYMPSILLVSIAWMSFWIDPKAVPARVTLGVTLNLSLNTMSSGTAEVMPVGGGVKALDVWLIVCQAFVFMALVEYTVANSSMTNEYYKQLKYRKAQRKQQSMKKSPDGELPAEEKLQEYNSKTEDPVELAYVWDKAFRYAFIICFLIFNGIYWFAYLYM
ncbi:glycine receptor subunit alpha-2-like [Patiria miniata]|uniref:Uncharacterized protein n=1 Tax=Patiria miniata TaxID=46514 RepID=A0A914A4Q7_PATMI|nr:glycine receptor subunit alpha-2-like [Patiria miniata]